MMFRSHITSIAILSIILAGSMGFVLNVRAASPPNIMTYQGRVLNSNSVPVSDTSLSMKFFLYTALTGGTCVWSNSSADCHSNTPGSTTARTVTLTSGLFTQNLGDTSDSFAAIGDSIFGDNATIYLAIEIAGETLSPRRLITAAPYALNADTLDGIDSATLQLWETGSSRTFEDDQTVVIGANAAFSYASGGVGDLRLADEIEVMGDGFIDDDLVIGASTSSTETIANTSFSLGGDDLFVAGDAGIEGVLYIDGNINTAGDVAVNGDDLTTDGDLTFNAASGNMIFADGDTLNIGLTTPGSGVAYNVIGDTTTGAGSAMASDDDLYIEGNLEVDGQIYLPSSAGINIPDGDVLSIYDGSGNAIFALTDLGTTGQINIGRISTNSGVDLNILTGGDDVIFQDGDVLNIGGSGSDVAYNMIGDSTTGASASMTSDDDLYIEGELEVDGTAAVADLSCTDCLDFGEIADGTVSVDASTVFSHGGATFFGIFNTSTSNTQIDLASTGDFLVSDNNDVFLTISDAGAFTYSLDSTDNPNFVVQSAGSGSAQFDLQGTGDFQVFDNGSVAFQITDTGAFEHTLDATDNPGYLITNNGTSNVTVNLASTGDFEVQDNGTVVFMINDSGNTVVDLAAAGGNDAVCATPDDGSNNGTNDQTLADCDGSPAADYAEQYPVESGIDYGDIVVPGTRNVRTTTGETISQLVKSSLPYQGPIVGIVSNNYSDFTSAGYNIAAADNPMPVALVGRVPVKVTNEGGEIHVGDYLTTSSTAGKAMKATKLGRVIGMALEEWDGQSETLMVQVNNSWYMGEILGTDGVSTLATDNVVVSSFSTATQEEPTFDSYGLSLRGSAWNGSQATAVSMMMKNVVESPEKYRLSIFDTAQTEVAYITNEGTMRIAGNMIVGGNIYPSDRGISQSEKYIYYDGSDGPAGDFMRTNAKGWSTGSYDFAEMFPSSEVLNAGDVVVFSGENHVVQKATGNKNEQLAGIVSTRPGFLAGENIVGSYPIALAGRVPTRVSGIIAVGDPLAPTQIPGVAAKATEPGQIIGYALENYDESASDDLILVYVNMGFWADTEMLPKPQPVNSASQLSFSATEFSKLNMTGNIFLGTHEILGIGRLEGIAGAWSFESDGTLKTEGLLTNVIDSYQNTKVETAAVVSPQVMITLSGTAALQNGEAEIRFEDVVPEYNDVISADAPIVVVATPHGPVSIFVVEKDQNHFLVRRFDGTQDVTFDWMVMGYRKGYEPVKKETVVEEEVVSVPVDFEPAAPLDKSVTLDSEATLSETVSEPTQIQEPEITSESASPASPDETIVDPKIEDEVSSPSE